ncbi:heat shock protein HtpX [Halococcus salifodinae DSM 8989]|uniref:Heat shock protein HtpX n=2 Tax=Halococcaceae TaxID=1963270 RepID=M0N4F8_9EURY|nr:heat shock protein HtpX [Halococcus salifodinae DSM 8989]
MIVADRKAGGVDGHVGWTASSYKAGPVCGFRNDGCIPSADDHPTMEWTNDWMLRVRMVVAVGSLAVVAAALAGVLFVAFSWLAALAARNGYLPGGLTEVAGAGATIVLVVAIVVIEGRYGDSLVLRGVDAREPSPEEFPDLHRLVNRVARQADLPVPTVLVAETTAPRAFTTGYTRDGATLVVSTGLLDVLDGDELSAVVAHELAHVKNRDVAVMMAMALPLVVAQTLMDWASSGWEDPNHESSSVGGIVGAVTFAVAGLFWVVGRVMFRLLSRHRELAADRGAVAIAGSPAALASALSTLDEAATGIPTTDARASASIAAFSIVPLEPAEAESREPMMLGPEGDRAPYLYRETQPLREIAARILRTHPDTDDRIARLQSLQRSL